MHKKKAGKLQTGNTFPNISKTILACRERQAKNNMRKINDAC